MINLCSGHKGLPAIVSLILAVCILFAGMRVPDISRPHRAKPKHRAVIENKTKTCQPSIKKAVELVALVPTLTDSLAPLATRTEFPASYSARCVSPLFPNSARAPPTLFT